MEKTERFDEINAVLDRVERDEGVTIFYACESGSRAWGFESRDSDYDVRFLYAHPTEWYLSVGRRRDVIERPVSDALDFSGWDLRKALGLLRKSNPPLLEWLQSPIVYRDRPDVTRSMRELIPRYCSPLGCFHHYLQMAQGNYREYLQGGEVWRKKYFYVLRPVLACLWIERGMGPVPTEFGRLVEAVVEDPAVKGAIDHLMESKREGREQDRGPRIPAISGFLDAQLERLSATGIPPAREKDSGPMDEAFRRILIELYGEVISVR